MKHRTVRLFIAGVVGTLAALAASAARAQDWPARPIRMIVSFSPGGPADIGARLVSQKLSEQIKQAVIVENRPGAAGNIGMEAAAKSAPDGYTFLYAITGLVTNPSTYRLNWDPIRDFTPVSQVSSATFVLISDPGFAPRTVADIVALARARPKEVTCAHDGSLPQIGCELLRLLGRIDITTVPYKGLSQALSDMISGQVNLMFQVQIAALPAVRSGRVRPIATTNSRRGVGPFGDLPTMAETMPGFEIDGWHGIVAPARTRRETVLRMNQGIHGVLSDGETRRRFADAGMEVAPSTPEEFGETLKRDLVKYERIIREAGIKAE